MSLAGATPFRYALAFAALASLVMGMLLAVVYWWTGALLRRHLDEGIEAQFHLIEAAAAQHGRAAVVGLIEQHERQHAESPMHFLVTERSGAVLAGDLPPMTPITGWYDLELHNPRGDQHASPALLRARGEWLSDDLFVLVTNDTRDLQATQSFILRSFAAALAVTVVLALGGGLMIARVLLRRVESVNRTAQSIMDGDFTQRVPIVSGQDELGGLAEIINRMLGRIEELMRDMQQVTDNIAHDLRTPLGRLRQRLEAARADECASNDQSAVLDAAIEECDTILQTFEAMLRIAQIEAGARRARFTSVDLSDVVANVVDVFRAAAEDDGKQLVTRIESALTVYGDRELLTQLLANLIDNGMRHTPVGTVLGVYLEANDGGVRLIVADSGPGIAASDRQRVFKRFFRAESSRTTSGAGLGLSLVAAISKLHSAEVWLEDNAPGLRVVVRFSSFTTMHGSAAGSLRGSLP
ncbi:MAG: HAMP domain-containing histidine kinase [Gammaproteobacteria bacterium]|nr:HAMP domain-containing histidine kinase [Gammaproteobacteria bacterium]